MDDSFYLKGVFPVAHLPVQDLKQMLPCQVLKIPIESLTRTCLFGNHPVKLGVVFLNSIKAKEYRNMQLIEVPFLYLFVPSI
jgi:hypothetical protein